MRLIKRIFACAVLFLVSENVQASTAEAYQGEKSNYLQLDENNSYGEKINEVTGQLSYEVIDFVIPGDRGLDITVSRSFDHNEKINYVNGQNANMANWRTEVPRIIIPTNPYGITRGLRPSDIGGTYDIEEYDKSIKRVSTTRSGICMDPYPGDGRASYLNSGGKKIAKKYWSGMVLKIPGQGAQQLINNTDYSRYPAAKWVTTNNWIASCTPDGNGFIVKSPVGITYKIDVVQANYDSVGNTITFNRTGNNTLFASEISNLHGGKIVFHYEMIGAFFMPKHRSGINASNMNVPRTEQRLLQITRDDSTTDKVVIDFEYANCPTYSPCHVDFINVQGEEYVDFNYERNDYDGQTYLTSVQKGSELWSYKYGEGNEDDKLAYRTENDGGYDRYYGPQLLTQVTLPSGGTIDYEYKEFQKLKNDPYKKQWKLHKRIVNNGYKVVDTAIYDYESITYTKKQSVKVTINRSGDTQTKIFSDDKSFQHGRLLRDTLQRYTSEGIEKREITYEYSLHASIGDFQFLEFPKSEDLSDSYTSLVVLTKKTINQDGNDYITRYLKHDSYGFPTKIKETFQDSHKYTKIQYYKNLDNWLLGLNQSISVSETDSDYELTTETIYHDETTADGIYNGLGLPYESRKFGRWSTRYPEYTEAGNLAKEEYNSPRRIGEGNRFTLYSDYKRGVPQTITIPRISSNDSVSRKQTVNDFGWITEKADFKGTKTGFKYDDSGRLVMIDLENDLQHGDWLDTLIEWDATNRVRTIKRCTVDPELTRCLDENLVYFTTIERYDGLLRLVQRDEHDDSYLGLSNNTQRFSRYQNFEYDKSNQIIFKSNFHGDPNAMGPLTGTNTRYDVLNRVTSIAKTGHGVTSFDYQSGNKIIVTDAGKNTESGVNQTHNTTTTYQAFGTPSYEITTKIVSPENVTTEMIVDIHGFIETITQSGVDSENKPIKVTEIRKYTSNKDLCLVKRPELGSTIYGHNKLGQMVWSKSGTSDEACVDSKPSNAISHSYDNQGKLYKVIYPDGTHTKIYSRDVQGNLISLQAGDVTHTYEYNNQNLVEKESLKISSHDSFDFNYDYNALLFKSTTHYPASVGLSISHKPNGFGLATEAIDYDYQGEQLNFATRARYYKNLILNTFTYGNGISHYSSLDLGERPNGIRDTLGRKDIVNLEYTYDESSNITSITNELNGIDSGRNLKDLIYDGLNRLTRVEGGATIGSSNIEYDSLGNITKYHSFNRALSYKYTNNRLSSVTGISGKYQNIQYDKHGNIINNGAIDFVFNDANQLTSANGHTYRYDGYNRRVYQSDTGGSYSIYSSDGLLLYREKGSALTGNGTAYIYLGAKLIAKYAPIEETNSFESNVTNTYRPYGESIGKTTAESKDGIGFTGHKYDNALGLNYMQARYYDPVIGRFYSNDPADYLEHFAKGDGVHGFNRYAYANNNPYKYIDPDGRDASLAPKDPMFTDPSDVQPIAQPINVNQLALNNAIGLVSGAMLRGAKSKTFKLQNLSLAVPGRVQSRINVSNLGFAHTMVNHLNPSKGYNKSQFTMTAGELKSMLSDKSIVKSQAVALETGNFARTITTNTVVGNLAEKFGGKATKTFTVITNREGTLQTAFPGTLER